MIEGFVNTIQPRLMNTAVCLTLAGLWGCGGNWVAPSSEELKACRRQMHIHAREDPEAVGANLLGDGQSSTEEVTSWQGLKMRSWLQDEGGGILGRAIS